MDRTEKYHLIFGELNIHLFQLINSFAKQSPLLDQIMIFLADDLNTVVISFLVFLLVIQWKSHSLLFAKTLFIVLLSLGLSELIEALYHHPRPFQLGLGNKLIGHGATSSFPSQHTLTIVIIAFSYLLAGFKKIGLITLALSVVVGLARIYVGVHFPFDIVGAFMVGFILVIATNAFMKELSERVQKVLPARIRS